jgi:hypothetical protein
MIAIGYPPGEQQQLEEFAYLHKRHGSVLMQDANTVFTGPLVFVL